MTDRGRAEMWDIHWEEQVRDLDDALDASGEALEAMARSVVQGREQATYTDDYIDGLTAILLMRDRIHAVRFEIATRHETDDALRHTVATLTEEVSA